MRLTRFFSNGRSSKLIVIGAVLLFVAQTARAWKPSTHVYLALKALDEILSTTDRFGNTKPFGTVPIYRVNYQTGEILDLLGTYEADQELIDALVRHRNEFVAGVLGPDAYPDIVTGQTRIHVHEPVHTDKWLEYLWQQAQDGDPEILAFVTGYLSHAAGDMYMHTFVNYYAGGPFTFNQSSNGLKHIILEGYIGKRTPELDPTLWELPVSTKVFDFVYENLVDARKGTYLHSALFKTAQLAQADPTQVSSVPQLYSMLRDGLQDQIDFYDQEIADFDTLIARKRRAAEACGPITNPTCAPLYAEMDAVIAQKALYQSTNFLGTEYLRAWVADIDSGLRAWPAFNHQMAKALVFSPTGIELEVADSLALDFRNKYLLSMSGVPDGVGGTLELIQTMKDIIFPPELREQIEEIKEHLLDQMLLATWGRTREQIEEDFKNPELYLDAVMAVPDPNAPSTPHAISLADLNLNILGLTDPGFQDESQRFDPDAFQPAYNTITMIKLLIMSPEGIAQLRNDMGCSEEACPLLADNAMLGFIKSLDGDNTWHRGDGIDWQPGPGEPQMVFADCEAFSQIFMKQIGEFNTCPPQLAAPVLLPESQTSTQPIRVSMSHDEPGAEIYYTISEVDQPVFPSNDPSQTRSHLYTQPFDIVAPLVGEVRPLVVRAKAFKDDFLASEVVEAEYTVDASLPMPAFFPNGGDFTGFVNVTIAVPSGATVFYTTDGQTPDYNSTQYTGQFQLGVGNHTAKAVAYRIGYAQSLVASATFNVYDPRTDRVADVEFNPRSSGDFTDSVMVSMLSRTLGAEVRYTIAEDQVPSDPTESSSLFTQPFKLDIGNWFIRAKAFKAGMPPSNLNQINYRVEEPIGVVNLPVIEPNGGTFHNEVEVTLSATTTPPTTGVQIFYTTDGSEPYVDPQAPGNYSQPFKIRRSSTLRVRARRRFFSWSGETSAEFRLECAVPQITPTSGTYIDSVEVTLQSGTQNATIRYTTDGSEPNEESIQYEGPFVLREGATVRAKAFRFGYFFSETVSANLAIDRSAPPVVLKSPVSRTAIVGDTVQFHVEYGGVPAPAVQWQHNGNPVDGATSDSLTLGPVALDDAGDYRALLTNPSGNDTSAAAVLTVNPVPNVPRILMQPKSLTVAQGDSAVLEVVAAGDPEPTYLWFRNGAPLFAQIHPRLLFDNVQLSHAGTYSVQVINNAGSVGSDEVLLTVNLPSSVESDASHIPARFALHQNYPNPFNPSTTIAFDLPRSAHVRLSLFDILGREIAILVDETLPAGEHKTVFHAAGLASGTYFLRMQAGHYAKVKRMLYLK